MTRTARSTSLRAMIKDRSETKSGLNPNIRKGGSGQHNWGNLFDERELEEAAMHDEELDLEADDNLEEDSTRSVDSDELKKPPMSPRIPSDEEIQSARQVRKNALKKGVDLSAIARTSAAVSPSTETKVSAVTPI